MILYWVGHAHVPRCHILTHWVRQAHGHAGSSAKPRLPAIDKLVRTKPLPVLEMLHTPRTKHPLTPTHCPPKTTGGGASSSISEPKSGGLENRYTKHFVVMGPIVPGYPPVMKLRQSGIHCNKISDTWGIDVGRVASPDRMEVSFKGRDSLGTKDPRYKYGILGSMVWSPTHLFVVRFRKR